MIFFRIVKKLASIYLGTAQVGLSPQVPNSHNAPVATVHARYPRQVWGGSEGGVRVPGDSERARDFRAALHGSRPGRQTKRKRRASTKSPGQQAAGIFASMISQPRRPLLRRPSRHSIHPAVHQCHARRSEPQFLAFSSLSPFHLSRSPPISTASCPLPPMEQCSRSIYFPKERLLASTATPPARSLSFFLSFFPSRERRGKQEEERRLDFAKAAEARFSTPQAPEGTEFQGLVCAAPGFEAVRAGGLSLCLSVCLSA